MGRPLDPKHDHKVSLPTAAEQARRYRRGGPYRKGDSGAFNASAILEVLNQKGCVGLRYYKGVSANGEDSMVLVGVDEQGNDMTAGVVLDAIFTCPPFCPDDNALNT